MDNRPSPRVEASRNDSAPTSIRQTPAIPPPSDLPSLLRRKVRNKSIRNTKDSAEMARGKLRQPSQSESRFPYPRVNQSPPTPPDTSDTHGMHPAFYWHDGLHESAAALVHRDGDEASPPRLRRHSSFDSGYSRMPEDKAPRLSLDKGPILSLDKASHPRLRSPSLDSLPKLFQHMPTTAAAAADTVFMPLLQIPIPDYRLGSPRFSARGTAFLHNSLYSPLSSTTKLHRASATPEPPRLITVPPTNTSSSIDLRRSPSVSWFSPSVSPAVETIGGRFAPSPLALPPLELEQDGLPSPVYDKVTANPDNTEWVQYTEGTKDIIAATPTRLIAEITSPRFLDYDLLSDFFLTYRAFLSPSDLAKYLISRLRWALSQSHNSGRIVRVRTFVALRHWILNYFVQDFEPDQHLRLLFCDLVNKLASELAQSPEGSSGDHQVLSELQKCWTRTCAMTWGSPATLQVYEPSGPQGEEDQSLAPAARSTVANSEPRNSSYLTTPLLRNPTKNMSSRLSETSIQANSCSFPRLKRQKNDLKAETQRPAHQSLQRPRGPFHRHKRSDSFSDALRDSRLDRPTTSQKAATVSAPPGRIIRGLVVHPGSASVIAPGPPSPPFLVRPADVHSSMIETLVRPEAQLHTRSKLLGTVRRALSTRSKSSSPSRPMTAVAGDTRMMKGAEPQPRDMIRQMYVRKAQGIQTDALAAMVMRSWEQQGNFSSADQPPRDSLKASVMRNRSKTIHTDVPPRPANARLDSTLTSSSRSILIMDDTGVDESLRTPTTARFSNSLDEQRSYDQITRQTTDEAAFQDIAMNNTAFLLPSLDNATEQLPSTDAARLAHLSTAPTTGPVISAPRSPPPTAPLPPLPASIVSLSKDNALEADNTSTPQSESMQSFGTSRLGSPQQSAGTSRQGSFRKSSLVDPQDLPGPARLLRRRPGGDLRAADTVQNLGYLQRRQSTGSFTSPLSVYRSSMSFAEDTDSQVDSQRSRYKLRAQSSDGDLVRHSSLRLLSTHSSQRQLRPSMEVEVARLRALSQSDDEGGVELALSKLEGRFVPSRGSDRTVKSLNLEDDDNGFPALTRQADRVEVDITSQDYLEGHKPAETGVQTSFESPLLGNDMPRFAHRRKQALDLAIASPPGAPVLPRHQRTSSAIATRDFARPLTPQQTKRVHSPATPASTFLLDDGESLADRNSILARSTEPQPLTFGDQSFLLDVEEDEVDAEPSKYYQSPAGQHPLTPPTTADNLSDHGLDGLKVQLLFPGPPSTNPRKSFRLSELLLSEQFAKKAEHSALPRTRNLPTQHTPFILAHSSEVLALQFTLIEKDALDSVDWIDLVNLNWSQKIPSARDWAQYVHSFPTNVTNVSSIDLIISRFNLVIKWCISSILLCSTPEERAQCITKFIHIAIVTRKHLHNFATTAQITVALLSSDLSRLTSTWALVAPAEKEALKGLETLVSPVRNFVALRSEMESAAAGLTDADISAGRGVIPFLGVYTRDLALNAQKPAFITPSTSDMTTDANASREKLVNFERHRTAASIVKGVLRLLDASSRYIIVPEAEVLAKCLWLAALADNEIAELSRGLES